MTFATFIDSVVGAINTYIVPFIFGLVFLAFLWGAARYFLLEGRSDESRAKGRQFVLWGLLGIFALIALWGIVNGLLSTLNLPSPLPSGG